MSLKKYVCLLGIILLISNFFMLAFPRLTWSGYISCDTLWDNYLGNYRRNGQEYGYPRKPECGLEGDNINARGFFGIIPVNTRLQLTVDQVEVCNADAEGVIMADFRGLTDETDSVFRMRKAYIQLDWPTIRATIGQWEHPMYVTDAKPNRVAYEGALYFDNRFYTSQLRLTFKIGDRDARSHHELWMGLIDESRDSRSKGPRGETVFYAREAALPGGYAQWRSFVGDFLFGVGVDARKLVPRLKTDKGYTERTHTFSLATTAYVTYDNEDLAARLKALYAYNCTEYHTLAGYAVRMRNEATDVQRYEPQRFFAVWGDVDCAPSCFLNPGLFWGIYHNLGCRHPVFEDPETHKPIFYGTAPDIATLFRFVPRVWLGEAALKLGVELEYTHALFGDLDCCGFPRASVHADGVRCLFSFYYFF